LRDAQVLAIWEGTTNVLSLDVLRAIEKDAVFEPFVQDVSRRLSQIKSEELKSSTQKITKSLAGLQTEFKHHLSSGGTSGAEAGARAFAWRLAEIYVASLAIEHAAASNSVGNLAVETANRLSGLLLRSDPVSLSEEYRQKSGDLLGF
jgi:putative acyl-CoA dehydrogenase